MSSNIAGDHFVIIKIEGMHCHKCEQTIRRAVEHLPGVREVEIDFASGQASILLDRAAASVTDLMEAINSAGYRATAFTQSQSQQPTR